MIKIQIKYTAEIEMEKMIKILSAATNIKSISEPYKSGKYYRVYLDIE